MKFLIIFVLTVISCALAAPQGHEVTVARYERINRPDKAYTFVYGLSDGQLRGESGVPKHIGEEEPIVVAGSFSFVAPDGQTYWVNYTADEFGYHPVIGTGPGGPSVSDDFGLDSNAIKSLIG